MSTTIDEKVVEMRFDNRNFEKNVQGTMSMLDKLKEKLKFDGASKSLDNLDKSANKVNMSGLNTAIETVKTNFSAMEVIGITALANITNTAVNAGKRMISALTIDPIKTGMSEYETQIGAIQTILSNTRKEGTNVEIVNKALDELNVYADKTIYNFTEMTKNIGTFTAAGVKLNDSVAAIKGIANLAAVSGSTSQQASNAMYQLSQALAAGKVQLMDWNSVVNAGMGGQLFQDALIRTSELLGTGAKAAIKAEGSFRESLTKSGWLTTEVLNETLKQLAGTYDKAELMAQGFTEKQAQEIVDLANDAISAATEVKTLTQLWDVLKESAQSGWAQTWRLIVGDFEEAKALFSPLAKFLTGIIEKFSNARNTLLEGALTVTNPFKTILDKIDNSALGKTISKIDDITHSLEYYQKVVNKVWRGDYKNQPYRFGLLEADGYNPHVVQTLVNKGYKYKLTVEDIAAAEKKHGVVATESKKAVEELTDTQLKEIGLTDEEIKMYRQLEEQSKKTGKSISEIAESMTQKSGRELLIESFANAGKGLLAVFTAIGKAWRNAFPAMTSVQLYNIIAALNSFSKKLVMSEDTADKLTRTLQGVFAILDLITMVVGGGLKIAFTVFKTILGAFDLDILGFTAILGDLITKIRDWIEEHNILTKAIQISVTYIIKFLKYIGKLIDKLMELPQVQRVVDKIRESLNKLENLKFKDVTSGLDKFGKKAKSVLSIIGNRLMEIPAVQKAVERLAEAFNRIKGIKLNDVISLIKRLGEAFKNFLSDINDKFNGTPGHIISGLVNGLKEGTVKVVEAIATLAASLINKFCDLLGINSPSKIFFAFGGFIIAGLIAGIIASNPALDSAFGGLVKHIKDLFSNIDWGKIFATGMSIGLLVIVKNITDAVKNVSSLFSGLGSMFASVGGLIEASTKGIKKILKNVAKVVKGFANVMNAIAFKKGTEGVMNLAWSLLILVGAIAILTKLDLDKAREGAGIILELAVILGIFALAMAKLETASISIDKSGLKVSGLKNSLLGIGAAFLLLAMTVKTLGKLDENQLSQGMNALFELVIYLGAFMAAYGLLVKGKSAQNMDKAGTMLRKMAGTLVLLVLVVKLAGKLTDNEMTQGVKFLTGFTIFVGLLLAVSNLAGKRIDKIGNFLLKLSFSLILMAAAVKLISKLSPEEMLKGAAFATAFVKFVSALIVISLFAGKNLEDIGKMVLSVSGALILMAVAVKILGGMDVGALTKGIVAVSALSKIIMALIFVTKLAGPEAPKLAATLIAFGTAIAILAAVAVVLSLISIGGLAKGIIAIGFLSLIIDGMLAATKNAKDVKGTLMGIAVAIGIMAASLTVLSLIDPTKLTVATFAMSMILGLFALVLSQSGNVNASWKTLLAIAAVIGVMGIILTLLSKSKWQDSIGAAIGLSIMIGTLAIVFSTLQSMGNLLSALKLAGSLLLLCIPLVAIAGILYLLKGVNNSIQTAVSLSILLLSLSGCLAILTVIGAASSLAYPAMLALAVLIAGLGGILIAIGALMDTFPKLETFLDKGIPILEKIGYALGSFFGNIVGGFMAGAVSGLPKIAQTLSLFMLNLTPFIIGSKMVDSKAMDGIKSLAEAILVLTAANLIDAIASFVTGENDISKFAESLPAFGVGLSKFGESIKDLNADKVKVAADAALTLVKVAEKIPNVGGLVAAVTGDNDIGEFGDKLKDFGTGLADFGNSVKNIKPANIKAASEAALTLVEVAEKIPNVGGLVAAVTGDNDIGEFGDKLKDFGTGLADFYGETKAVKGDQLKSVAQASKSLVETAGAMSDNNMSSFFTEGFTDKFSTNLVNFGKGLKSYGETVDGTNTGAIEKSVDAAKGILEVVDAIPSENGWLQKFTGEKDFAGFTTDMSNFGKALVAYSQTVVGVNTESILNSSKAAGSLVDISNSLPEVKEGNSTVLKTYADDMINFGKALVVYSQVVTGVNTESIINSAIAADGLIDIANKLPKEGGLLSLLSGSSSLTDFAKQLIPFGVAMKAYSTITNGVNTESIVNSVTAAEELVYLIDMLPDNKSITEKLFGNGKDVNFASSMVPLATGLVEYSNKSSEINFEAITASETAFNSLRRILDSVSSVDTSKVEIFNSVIKSFKSIDISGLVSAFNSVGGQLSSTGLDMMIKLTNGIKEGKSRAVSMVATVINAIISKLRSFNNEFSKSGKESILNVAKGMLEDEDLVKKSAAIAKSSVDVLRDSYDDFKKAGSYVVTGFADGIDANIFAAKASAKIMAQQALTAAKEALDENSPSKEFYHIGDFAGLGFINALIDSGQNAYKAGYSMAESSRDGLSKALSRVADFVSLDIDSQPTIRPILDLSNVQNGVNNLNTMFNNTPSLDVLANVNAINSGINSRIQNGSNDDVISALKNLGNDIKDNRGNTYNINGVNYTENSDVQTAIKQIIRAVNIEKRS